MRIDTRSLFQRAFDELAAVASVPCLDDYEEGTWTPTIEGWDSNGKQIAMPGTWVKMGNVLMVSAAIEVRHIRVGAKGAVPGNFRIVLER